MSVFIHYSLSAVGATSQLNVGYDPIIRAADNRNGFAQTITVWISS